MKNFIKVITIFGVAIFVSPVHSAEEETPRMDFNSTRALCPYKDDKPCLCPTISPLTRTTHDIEDLSGCSSCSIIAILKEKFKKQEKLSRKLIAYIHDGLGIEISEDIVNLITSLLPECNVDNVGKDKPTLPELIKQAKQELKEEQEK